MTSTFHAIAPEVLSGGPYNHTADWWSLGVLLFSLATGKVREWLLVLSREWFVVEKDFRKPCLTAPTSVPSGCRERSFDHVGKCDPLWI